jgi:uncharacterized membrane protein
MERRLPQWLVLLVGSLSLVWILALGVTGCSGSSGAPAADAGMSSGQCSTNVPASCPASMPHYNADVLPILQRDCIPCHGPGTGGKDESTYALVSGQRSPILDQVGLCLMPLPGSPQLTDEERFLLLAWLVCGAQDN